jgi:NAD(P)-dependent dehydrogenase (short-subunit alcohol dehydrogenase family)
MDYQNRHAVVTGGTGALGTAVVGTLLPGGAVCHVPYYSEEEAKRFAHRDHKQSLAGGARESRRRAGRYGLLRWFEHAVNLRFRTSNGTPAAPEPL